MRNIDLSSWESIFSTLLIVALVTVIGVGVRLFIMMRVQQRRERLNRQINERLRTLIAAYKVLGGSFTGELTVDPRHLRDVRRAGGDDAGAFAQADGEGGDGNGSGSDRRRRIRDAVEAALSDIILLGTEDQVRLAERAARELVEGRPAHTHELVVSLRAFIRSALDLEPVPADLAIPMQGPTRPSGSGSRGQGKEGGGGSGRGGGAGMGAGGMAVGGGMGMMAGGSVAADADQAPEGKI